VGFYESQKGRIEAAYLVMMRHLDLQEPLVQPLAHAAHDTDPCTTAALHLDID
jgi:hypothetical protein